jgi:hypothetical protein
MFEISRTGGKSMKERIRELMIEAGIYECDDFEPHPTFEKFAELIVKECAGIAKKEQAFNAQYTDANMHPQVNIDQCILMGFGL